MQYALFVRAKIRAILCGLSLIRAKIRAIYKLTTDRVTIYLQSGSFFQFVGMPIL